MNKHSFSSGIILLQRVDKAKLKHARTFRRNMTAAEKILWEKLRRNQILGLKFRRQQIIDKYVADFYCDRARLVIEVDGEIHETPELKNHDEHRRDAFHGHGLDEIRFKNSDILHNPDRVVAEIARQAKIRIGVL